MTLERAPRSVGFQNEEQDAASGEESPAGKGGGRCVCGSTAPTLDNAA
jgi:hypothetical protein